MTISFQNDNDVIVFAFEKITSFARENQYIFLAQSIWWISSIIGLQPGWIIYINNQQSCSKKERIGREVTITPSSDLPKPEVDRQDTILKECKDILRNLRQLRDIANLKSTSRTVTGRIHPLKSSREALKESNRGKDYSKTEGIEQEEIERRRAAGEYLRCAWPSDRKGSHRVKDCIRPLRRDKGTASYPKAKKYQRTLLPSESDKEEYDLQPCT